MCGNKIVVKTRDAFYSFKNDWKAVCLFKEKKYHEGIFLCSWLAAEERFNERAARLCTGAEPRAFTTR